VNASSSSAQVAQSVQQDDSRRNIWLLAGGQAMQISTNATLIAINDLAGDWRWR